MADFSEYFKGNEKRLKRELELHKKKLLLKEKLKNSENIDSYVVELCGLPRTGKTNATQRVFSFFKYGGIDVKVSEEPAYLVKNSVSNEKLKQMSKLDFNDKTLEVSKTNLEIIKKDNPTIILMDRGIIDNYFWYQMMYQDNIINKETYEDRLQDLYFDLSKIDRLLLFLADPKVIIKRDYLNEIYLDERSKTTIDGVTKLKKGYETLLKDIEYMSDNIQTYDTTYCDEINMAMDISETIMDDLDKKLILI